MTESVIDFPKHELCPDVWEKVMSIDGMNEVWQLKHDVKDKMLEVWKQVCPSAKVIHITGSITSNSYTENADIDVHFLEIDAAFNDNLELERFQKEIRSRYKKTYIGKHPIEVYYQDNKFQDFMSVGCYDVLNEKWLVGPEFVDQSFNPYSEYYKDIQVQSDGLAKQIRNTIFSIYEIAVVMKKNINTEFGNNIRNILLSRLTDSQKLYDNIRQMRKIYSSPTSIEQALEYRKSRKWKVADASFKLFDKYGYMAILKQFIEDYKLLQSSTEIDIEVIEDILNTVKNYINNADKLSEKELHEDEAIDEDKTYGRSSESKKEKSTSNMTPDEYSQYFLHKIGADQNYIPRRDKKSILQSLANEYIMKAPTDTAAREVEMDAALLLVKSNNEEDIELGKKLGDMIIDGKGGEQMLNVMRKAWHAFLEMPNKVNETDDNKVKIWVDDVRPTPHGYMTIQSVDEFIEWFDKNGSDKIEVLDLDHDAGKFHDNGGDYIKILDYLEFQGVENLNVRIHSDNPVGRQNMQRIIKKNGWKELHELISDTDQVDEGVKEAVSAGLLAAMLAIPGILPAKTIQKSMSTQPSYSYIVNDVNSKCKKIGDYTSFQAANIIARTLFAEARNDGEKGMMAVASVIYNRANGKVVDFANVCKKHAYSKKAKKDIYQFSCWNKMNDAEWLPKNFKVKLPSSVKSNSAEQKLWEKAMEITAEMLAGTFSPITDANMYYNDKTSSPLWGNQLSSVKYIGSHKFGVLKNHAPFV